MCTSCSGKCSILLSKVPFLLTKTECIQNAITILNTSAVTCHAESSTHIIKKKTKHFRSLFKIQCKKTKCMAYTILN